MGDPLTEVEKRNRIEALLTAYGGGGGGADSATFISSGKWIKPTGIGAATVIKPAKRVLDFIASEPWAITSEALQLIDGIAQRTNEQPEAVAAKLGRPLSNTRGVEMRNDVAVIDINGPIFRYANIFTEISGATSLELLALDFQTALDDPAVESIVLNIDSPGGMAAGVAEFADMVRAADKPVTAYIGALGASGAYWIAAAAGDVVVNKAAEVGSIGVIMGVRVNDDKNVRDIVSSQSPNKRPNPDTDAGRNELQSRVDALANVFIESVAQFRDVDVETVINGFGRGGVKLGDAAVRAGMADRLGSLETVIAGLSGSNERSTLMGAKTETPEITAAYIAAEHPAIADFFRAEGESKVDIDSARTEAAKAERERIKAVLDIGEGTGHEDLVRSLAFDGTTMAPEAAVKVVAAEKAAKNGKLSDLRKDAPDPVAPDAGIGEKPKANPNLPIDERAKAEWDSDPDIRSEFDGDFETYLAYARAQDAGQVKVLSK